MPVLTLDAGDVADGDVAYPDAGVFLQVGDIGQLHLDRVGPRAATGGTRQRQRVEPAPPAATGCGQDENGHQCCNDVTPTAPPGLVHDPPPGGTIIPGKPA